MINTTSTSIFIDQSIPNGTFLNTDTKDTRILQINNLSLFGLKDSSGRIQTIYAIQTANTIYVIDRNSRLSPIQSKTATIRFQYNTIQSEYRVNIITQNSSYEIPSIYNTPDVTFPQSKSFTSIDPLTGILVQLENNLTHRFIDDAILQLSFSDETTAVMVNVAGGRYYLPLPTDDSSFINESSKVNNFRTSVVEHCRTLIELIRGYPMQNICVKNRNSTRTK